jgi:hypothetical protein
MMSAGSFLPLFLSLMDLPSKPVDILPSGLIHFYITQTILTAN